MVRKVNQPMSAQIKESDWKVFKEISPVALNRFCDRILSELRRAADDPAKSPHERYLAIYKLIERHDKEIADAYAWICSRRRASATTRACRPIGITHSNVSRMP